MPLDRGKLREIGGGGEEEREIERETKKDGKE